MTRILAHAGILTLSLLFIACPKQEAPVASALRIQIQGHVYDSQTKQAVADSYVGLWRESRTDSGIYAQMKVVETRTDSGGYYTLQCSLDAEPCKGAKLFLMPISSDNGTGTRIGCTEGLQTIDLYRP